ncbi:hypothetical protein [Clavibacter phaseoli]|uniref:hypothetical protein n=2 Tax=Clavibacter phaseoli TaxID=1734031 RepID=UPI001F188F2D|nr:hypothetical protein [Clavibacter phaseoli]UKF30697.1 hypothetical protein FGD69_06365 [Clavibacter phaseoli]UKF36615.1 hypothetical protein FGI33_05745 [Clavibacter phaseoli]
MTPSHDAPDPGPTSFDDGPAPATLGLSRREMRAAERARARELGIDEADDAPAEDASAAVEEAPAAPAESETAPAAAADDDRPAEASSSAPEPLSAPGVGPETSAILLSGGVLTRRQLRAIREAEEAARQQRGSDHGEDADGSDRPAPPEPAATTGSTAAPVDDAPPTPATEPSVPPYARYGRGSRATPRPRAPYGSAYRRSAPAETPDAVASEEGVVATSETTTTTPETSSTAADALADRSSETPSAWPFAPIVPSDDAADRDVDDSGEQPTVPPLASHVPSRDEDPRPAPSLEPAPWVTGSAAHVIEPAFGTRASAATEGVEVEDVDAVDRVEAEDRVVVEAPGVTIEAPDARTPFTPPTGHWSVQDQVDEDQPHTGNHFILPSVPHANDMQQALNSTGEIIITGSIDLPRSLGSMGTHPDRFDTADMDRILEQGDDHDHAPAGSDSEPVRASRAVSTHTSTRAVVQPPPRKRFTAPVVAAVTAGGVAVIGAGLVIVAFMTNVF